MGSADQGEEDQGHHGATCMCWWGGPQGQYQLLHTADGWDEPTIPNSRLALDWNRIAMYCAAAEADLAADLESSTVALRFNVHSTSTVGAMPGLCQPSTSRETTTLMCRPRERSSFATNLASKRPHVHGVRISHVP